jgi:glutamate--cysteine ligase
MDRRLLERVRADCFAGLGEQTRPRLGLEVEVLPMDADGQLLGPVSVDGSGRDPEASPSEEGAGVGAPAPNPGAADSSLPVLRSCARAQGWTEEPGSYGLPSWRTSNGGWVTFEPGGQVEFASPVSPDLDTLAASVHDALEALGEAFDRVGATLVARGLDPIRPLAVTRRFMDGERYRRQEAHYDRRGSSGRRMMRQSLALHVNVDVPGAGIEAWWAANALAPTLTALFANSPRSEGVETGWRSGRSALWRTLDPSRTGVFAAPAAAPAPSDSADHAVRQYAAFAARAEVFAFGPHHAEPVRLEAALAAGSLSDADLSAHLTTLFPEVRPRRYLELRSIDALPLRWALIPAAFVVGTLFAEPERSRVLRELPPAHPARLERAGREGVLDPGLRAEAEWLVDLAITALDRDPLGMAGRRWAEALDQFAAQTLRRGLDPGGVAGDLLL